MSKVKILMAIVSCNHHWASGRFDIPSVTFNDLRAFFTKGWDSDDKHEDFVGGDYEMF